MSEVRNEDRISKYLSPRIQNMMFAELSPDYLSRTGALEILSGVAVPVGYEGSDAKGETDLKNIVLNMGRVIGGDPYFVFAEKYVEFIKHAAGDNAAPMLVSEGVHAADMGDFEDACMLLRGALRIEPKSPDFAMGYYFLGYAYLNMGLYLKAKLTWQDFLKHSAGSEMETYEMDDQLLASLREEISERVEELEEPVEIELGCNKIMGGDFAGGRDTLARFKDGRYSEWWPLWYYLGIAESSLANPDAAIEAFKRVLQLSPSNIDAMEELVHIYEATGDTVNAAKYRNKIGIINRNLEEEKAGMLS